MKLLWQQISNTTVTEILCSTQMDGIVLDCEHGFSNNETLVDCIRVIKLSRKKAFVRMKHDKQMIQLCVDNGVDGLIYSDCVGEVSYNPGIGLVEDNFWGKKKVINPDIIQVAQIERSESIFDFPCLAIEGFNQSFDYYMIGMYDLSKSISSDLIGRFKDEDFLDCINEFEKKLPIEKRGIHLVKDIDKNYNKYKDYGLQCFSLDTLGIIDKVKELNKYV